MILIVWDTRGDGHDSDAVYWSRWPGVGWSTEIADAREYPSRDEADHDLTAARETVHRGVQRGRVDVQEIF